MFSISETAIILCLFVLSKGSAQIKTTDETATPSHFLTSKVRGGDSGIADLAVTKAQTKSKSCFASRKHEISCCASRIKNFEGKWYAGGNYLQTFFQELKFLKCPQLEKVCSDKVYARFSEYSRLVYEYHCNFDHFLSECKDLVAQAREMPDNASWSKIIHTAKSSEFETKDLEKPCVQVALYESLSGRHGFYHEIVDVYIPFCDISWCGFDTKTVEEREISTWNCIPSSCKTSLIIACVVCALLAAAIIFANVTVIIVFTTSPKLRNSQAVYKISLAIADLLVGVIVLPTFVSTLMILYQGQASMGDTMPNQAPNSEGTLPRKSGGKFRQRLSSEYINFVGFFTILSLVISIYTLMMASFDRFMAVYKPLSYGLHKAKKTATWSCLALWIIAIFFSAMPFFVDGIDYGLVASIMVASLSSPALILYAIIILLPLVLVWITTIATYISTRNHARIRRTLKSGKVSSTSKRNGNLEARLARTLAAMVGSFTLCLLPVAIILIVPHFLNNIYHDNPKVFDPKASKVFVSMEFVTIIILMTNSLWNCFIYNARSEEFKKRVIDFYARLLTTLGFSALWKKTKDFATSTVRSRRTSWSSSLLSNTSKKTAKSPGEEKRDDSIQNQNGKYSETYAGGMNVYRYTHDNRDSTPKTNGITEATVHHGPIEKKQQVANPNVDAESKTFANNETAQQSKL